VTIRKGLPAKLALTDANDTRYLFSGLVVCSVDGSPRGGVLSPVGVNLVTSSATMNVSVARFQGVAVRDGGVILLANDGAANVLLDAAPGANSRIDVIYAKQNDASGTVTVPDANNTALLTFVKGTAGAVPVKPTLPVGALELATVLIPSGATATNSAGVVITQTAQFTASAGSPIPVRVASDLTAMTTFRTGQLAECFGDQITYRYNGSAWKGWFSPWITATPTVANITVGNGTLTGRYRFNSGTCVVEGTFVLGSTSAVSAAPRLTHPVTADSITGVDNFPLGGVTFLDAGVAAYMGFVQGVNTTSADIRTSTASGTYTTPGGLSSTVPFTFGAADRMMWRYEFGIA
jgi:hypothetical protein